ncbi:hypothetical protein AB1Y20_003004 [Prymnesium parvum]|uniref:Ribosome-binding factor A n=1 Tax=Prymnesium parvum TaxID=97485 RepID=A0AB34JC01_PRYPA
MSHTSVICNLLPQAIKMTSNRQFRVAHKVRRALVEGLDRGVMRNAVLRDGRAVSVLDVHVSPDLSIARCFWEPELEEDHEPARRGMLERALQQKTGFLSWHVNTYLRQKRASRLEFVSVINAQPTHYAAKLKEALEKAGGNLTAPDLVAVLPPQKPQ